MTTTLITGVNKSLGRETARRLLAAGHDVWISARDPQRGQATADKLGGRFVALDVTDEASVKAAAERVAAEGGLDVLVNNAGIGGPIKAVVGTMVGYQQTLGSGLLVGGIEADPDAMYLRRERVAMIWPYDERGRLVGENVWEDDDGEYDLIKLEPDEVLTTEQAAALLEPFIKRLPPFDDSLLPS